METSKLYIGNLSFQARPDDVRELFQTFGEVTDVNLIERDGVMKGFGFVEFATVEEAKQAKTQLDGKELLERPMKVDFATPREPRNDNRDSGRRNRY